MIPHFNQVWKRSIMSQIPKVEVKEIVPPKNGKSTGTVIFLHGAGGAGNLLREWVEFLIKDCTHPYLKIVFPTAPLRKYTAHGGQIENVWFDRQRTTPDSAEQVKTLNEAAEELKKIVQQEIDSGIPAERIIIGGFSMGGSMSLHMGYRIVPNIGGVFALSSFLNNDSLVYKELLENKPSRLPPLFFSHGDRDDLVLLKWGQKTFQKLEKLGVQGEFTIKKNALHELKQKELKTLWEWFSKIIPEK